MAQAQTKSILDAGSFDAIADLAYRESGLILVPEKATMVQSRLRHRLQALGLQDFAEYSAFVNSNSGVDERKNLICALTTNVSHFFRENHHFDDLCALVKKEMTKLRAGGRFRIWSAGCSNGQEPLSAAMTLLDAFPELSSLDFRILATDIDEQVIKLARSGTYSSSILSGLSDEMKSRFFDDTSTSGRGEQFTAKPAVLSLIRHNELNLLGRWPMKQQFDVIFCRNVVIYFDLVTQEALWPRFRKALTPGGKLYLGHSERIADPEAHGFSIDGPTTYIAKPS